MTDFLSRWSRLKRGVSDEKAPAPARRDDAPDDAGPPPLPLLDDITADTDIRGFLSRDVQPELRKAALRRAWMTDPTIRDFVGPARDYAYDWNTPGGVPGFGPLAPAAIAQATRFVSGMFTDVEPDRDNPDAELSPEPERATKDDAT